MSVVFAGNAVLHLLWIKKRGEAEYRPGGQMNESKWIRDKGTSKREQNIVTLPAPQHPKRRIEATGQKAQMMKKPDGSVVWR